MGKTVNLPANMGQKGRSGLQSGDQPDPRKTGMANLPSDGQRNAILLLRVVEKTLVPLTRVSP